MLTSDLTHKAMYDGIYDTLVEKMMILKYF